MILLSVVRQNYDISDYLGFKFTQLIIPFLDLFIEGLIFNFELLKVNQVKTVCELLLLTKHFLLVCQSVTQSNVLKAILMNFLVFCRVSIFPLFNHLSIELLAIATKNSVLGDWALKLFELMLNLLAFRLLFIKFCLKFTRHSVVAVLCVFQVKSNLMYVG